VLSNFQILSVVITLSCDYQHFNLYSPLADTTFIFSGYLYVSPLKAFPSFLKVPYRAYDPADIRILSPKKIHINTSGNVVADYGRSYAPLFLCIQRYVLYIL